MILLAQSSSKSKSEMAENEIKLVRWQYPKQQKLNSAWDPDSLQAVIIQFSSVHSRSDHNLVTKPDFPPSSMRVQAGDWHQRGITEP